MPAQDNLNCLKNLMQLMCCDGNIDAKEKAFLSRAAEELAVSVNNWNTLLKDVLDDNIPFYPFSDRERACAALQAFIALANADGRVDEKEKDFVLKFAKSIGVSKSEWQQLLGDIDTENLFTSFQQSGSLIAIKDNFEKIDAFVEVAEDNGAAVQITDLKTYLQTDDDPDGVVCFHAAEEKDTSLSHCQLLQNKAGHELICILNRFQGHQVKYLHEIGVKKCIIEPVYTRDITDIFKTE